MYALIVINYGTAELIKKLLSSAKSYLSLNCLEEVIIVDNGFPGKGDIRESIDPREYSFPIKFVQNPQHSYSSGVNLGVSAASSQVVILANSDIEFIKDNDPCILVEYLLAHSEVGIVGPQQVYPSGNWQRSWGFIPCVQQAIRTLLFLDSMNSIVEKMRFYVNIRSAKILKKTHYLDGAFLVLRRQCFDDVGGFDEGFAFYAEDADLCYRISLRGWKIAFLPNVKVSHIRGGTSSRERERAYAEKMQQANIQFIHKHYGSMHAKAYIRILCLAFQLRIAVLTAWARIIKTPSWAKRLNTITFRYQALRELLR
ncbi:hypothetical protein SY88_00125 [Clostridiales bacterium PH28_bin88]|nr:hypothetical protein SY88_00125 [Clostridiales bacterium PH28_bin88]